MMIPKGELSAKGSLEIGRKGFGIPGGRTKGRRVKRPLVILVIYATH
jgi:hypothetical protein